MIDKAKILNRLSKLWARRAEPYFYPTITLIVIFILVIVWVINVPAKYEPDGLETNNIPMTPTSDYAYLQANYQQLTADYNALRDSFVTAAGALELADQTATAYKDAYYELFTTYQAMDVKVQLLEANNEGEAQSAAVSQEFHNRYNELAVLYKEKSEQYSNLVKDIDQVSNEDFFVVTENLTRTDIDSFYLGWDIWIESLEDED